MERFLPVWLAVALVLQGVALPAPKGEDRAGLLTKGPALVQKEDRGSGSPAPLLPALPKPPRALPEPPREGVLPSPAPAPLGPDLYLLYLRLQLDGG